MDHWHQKGVEYLERILKYFHNLEICIFMYEILHT